MITFNINDITVNNNEFILISGPCAIESKDHSEFMAGKINEITTKLNIPFIFKSSFDKANRTSINSKRGIGIEKGLNILYEIKKKMNIPVLTDVHDENQARIASNLVDVIQIPAFLCRQTDLLITAAESAKLNNIAINIKKGQFLAPHDMQNVVNKISNITNKIMLCERGVSFGYNTLISDMRSIDIMKDTGYPVIFDATHSVQQPGGLGDKSGGQRQFVNTLAKAATAVGVAGIFMECHDNPEMAPSDGPNMIHLNDLENALYKLKEINEVIKK